MNNIEGLMKDLVGASVDLKRKLCRRDEFAATSPEGTDGPRVEVHTCRLCNRSAAGEGAQVCHKSDCALARLLKSAESTPVRYGPRCSTEDQSQENSSARCAHALKWRNVAGIIGGIRGH